MSGTEFGTSKTNKLGTLVVSAILIISIALTTRVPSLFDSGGKHHLSGAGRLAPEELFENLQMEAGARVVMCMLAKTGSTDSFVQWLRLEISGSDQLLARNIFLLATN